MVQHTPDRIVFLNNLILQKECCRNLFSLSLWIPFKLRLVKTSDVNDLAASLSWLIFTTDLN